MVAERLNTFHDASGNVTVGVFRARGAPASHHIDEGADVPEDMVAVGGGAIASEGPPGAFLTASYPNGNMSGWLASSKDHQISQAHILTVYAIGLKINGMSRQQLLDNIHVSGDESGSAPHPEASTAVPGGFVMLGGGFRVDWLGGNGNLATASFPSTDRSWTARSKDHSVPGPANLKVFAVSIREVLPAGPVSTAIRPNESGVSAHPSAAADVPDGFALTGGGADVHFSAAGNLLWRLEPTTSTSDQNFAASSKDHKRPDPSSMTVFALGMRIG